MGFELGIFLVSILAELLLFVPFIWRYASMRLVIAICSLIAGAFGATALFAMQPNLVTAAIVIIGIYRWLNLFRLIKAQMHDKYLYISTCRTSLLLIVSTVVISFVIVSVENLELGSTLLYIIAGVQCLVAVMLLLSTARTMYHTRTTATVSEVTTADLPSVTIAVPARNETTDLEECLDSIIQNNYAKLEILVLDDCSQMRRTPEIIRSYAHKGVRFVKGDIPAENWLAKNQAYNKLLNEANGEIVIFCGVDIRLAKDSIYQMVNIMAARDKKMISILPIRSTKNRVRFAAIQSARYMWELVPPRRLFNRPPVLSSVWAIYRSEAKRIGGFKAVSRTILPERFFARQMLAGDNYSFLRASQGLAMYSAKTYSAQRSTATRVRYPQLRRRPETVLAVTSAMVLLLIAPYILAVYALTQGLMELLAISALTALFLTISYSIVSIATRTMSWYIAPFMHLPVVMTDIALMHYSMYRYEFSEVVWKDRNICVPVMHVIPKLPEV